jgi:hypothetical protein
MSQHTRKGEADSSEQAAEPEPTQPPIGLLDLPGCLLAQIWLQLQQEDKDALFCTARRLHTCPGEHLLPANLPS